MRHIFTILFTILILGGCSKSPTFDEVVEICLAETLSDIPEDQRTDENIKFFKDILIGSLKEKEKEEGDVYLENALSFCKNKQSEEKNENVNENKNKKEPYSDACLKEGIADWIKETGKEPDEFEKGSIIKGCASEDWGN